MASSAAALQTAVAKSASFGLKGRQPCAAGKPHGRSSCPMISHVLPARASLSKNRAATHRKAAALELLSGAESRGYRAFSPGNNQLAKHQKAVHAKSSFLGSSSAFAVHTELTPKSASGGSSRGGALTAEANLFSRIYRIFVSTVTGAVKSQEDPSKLLDQAVIDMEGDLGKVKQATAAVLGSQRQLEQKYNGASQVARMWYDRARLALSKGEEDLARKALEMRKIEEDKARSYKDQLDKQTAIANKLVANTKLLESKIKEAQSKKDSLKYRAEAAKATQSIQEMLGQIDTSKAIYAFEKLEEDVLRAEAKADALSDMVTSDMDAKFAALESDSAVEDDLQQLKNSMNSSRTLPAPKASESGGKSVFWKEYVDPRVEMELAEMRGQINAQY